jgi:hypothetical protein
MGDIKVFLGFYLRVVRIEYSNIITQSMTNQFIQANIKAGKIRKKILFFMQSTFF